MEKSKNYVTGILGGIIGGLIATLPWILMYAYGNMILSLLAIIVAIGVLKGYQICNGKVDHKLPIIITIVSLLCITIATFIIIPALLMTKEEIAVNVENFKILFAYKEFTSALIKDYIISIIFTFLGISGVIANVKKQLEEGKTENIKASIGDSVGVTKNKENIEVFRNAFSKYNATTKETAVEKEKILKEIDLPNAKGLFNNLCMQQIIAKYKGKYYFKEKYANSMGKRFVKLYLKVLGIILLIVLFIIFLAI